MNRRSFVNLLIGAVASMAIAPADFLTPWSPKVQMSRVGPMLSLGSETTRKLFEEFVTPGIVAHMKETIRWQKSWCDKLRREK